MKKRLFALALCLVLATSLLPLTAAAAEWHSQVFVGLKNGGVYCEDVQFEFHSEYLPAEWLGFNSLDITPDSGSGVSVMTNDGGKYTLHVKAGVECPTLTINCKDGEERHGPSITLKNGHDWGKWISNGDGTHSRSCQYKDTCGGYETKTCVDTNRADCKCDDCGASMHNWQFEADGDTLTGTCNHDYCPTKKISVTLKADSVTLPDSPFNAWLEGWEQLVSEFPEAKYKFEYKYKAPGDSEYHIVEPTAANAKAGEYQVGVYLWDITRGPIDPSEGTYLFVKYTAVDPAITAQTGDNRPIEIMMASVLVFSALAAAAFILDSKRKYSR